MAKMGKILTKLDQYPLPAQISPPAREMLAAMAKPLPFPASLVLRMLMNPLLTNRLLKLLGEQGRLFAPLLRNTVSPTNVNGKTSFNVIPAKVVLQLDGRVVPGCEPATLLGELEELLGDDVESLEMTHSDQGPPAADMGLFPTLAGILQEMTPKSVPVPLLLAGGTDARFFARLGIQTYGFLPMPMPQDLKFSTIVHAANERVPAAAIDFGTDAIYRALCSFHG